MDSSAVTACVLIIGDEILSGRTQDVNLTHIATELNEIGIQVSEAHVLPDDEAILVDNIRKASERFDYVITTGGIGRPAAAEGSAHGLGIVVLEEPPGGPLESLRNLRDHFGIVVRIQVGSALLDFEHEALLTPAAAEQLPERAAARGTGLYWACHKQVASPILPWR